MEKGFSVATKLETPRPHRRQLIDCLQDTLRICFELLQILKISLFRQGESFKSCLPYCEHVWPFNARRVKIAMNASEVTSIGYIKIDLNRSSISTAAMQYTPADFYQMHTILPFHMTCPRN